MRKIVFFVMMAICSVNIYGQELTDEEAQSKKKEINGIKLSEEAVYADVVELALDDNEAISLAQQKSINLLQTHVIEIFAKRMNMSKADVQEIWDVIDDKCQNIVVRKGDLLRVFSYIMKDAIGLGPKKPNKDDVKEYFGSEEEADTASVKEAAFELANVMMGGEKEINTLPEKKVEEKVIETQDTKVGEETKVTDQNQTSTVAKVIEEKVVSVEEKTIVVGGPGSIKPDLLNEDQEEDKVKSTQGVNVPELCQEIIEQGNYNKLMVYLGKKKAENKLMFGNPNRMQYVERCYVVLFEKKSRNIVTVLDKGEGDRMNFVTKQMDHLKNYKNGQYGAIYVQEF